MVLGETVLRNEIGMKYLRILLTRQMAYLLALCAILLVLALGSKAFSHQADTLNTATFNFPKHSLSISLPRGFWLRDPGPSNTVTVNLANREFLKDDYLQLASVLNDFTGSIWLGPPGSLRVTVSVQKRHSDYPKRIQSLDELQSYIRWFLVKTNSGEGSEVSQTKLNGVPAVVRKWYNLGGNVVEDVATTEIYSLPLSDDLFVNIGFVIITYSHGRESYSSWLPKSIALREAIVKSIQLRSSGNAGGSQH
jgi:hypothetical protein